MKIKIFSFGKPKFPFIQEGINEYEGRLNKLVSLDNIFLKEQSIDKKNISQALLEEEKQILKHYKPNASAYLLVENSQEYSSEQFAKQIENDLLKTGPEFQFFIGSPYGFSDNIKAKFNRHLSLSSMTFTHDMARMILLEQIYRAITIMKNIPYHN